MWGESMPRRARQSSKTGIYHIMLRGINRQSIFEDDEDREKFLQVLNKYKEICRYLVYGYCLMDNHIHLLIKEGEEFLADAMKRIGASYVYWYNRKYERCGHLFQDRYMSEPVEDDSYLLTVLRYIHQNPLKAKIVNHIKEYKWSSYGEYLGKEKIIEPALIFNILSEDLSRAKGIFVQFMNQSDDSPFLDINETKKISDKEAKEIIERYGNLKAAGELRKLEKDKRDEVLRKLKQIQGISTRQIARITGISQSVITRA
ncbi:transposase [Desulforamulus putei]|uniref:transposase n=1 Tax=Desulforamulus putei TaxID=74701 RepID=UPI003A5C2D31